MYVLLFSVNLSYAKIMPKIMSKIMPKIIAISNEIGPHTLIIALTLCTVNTQLKYLRENNQILH